jgi:HSP20 family molecular chaperone IbpA
MALFNTLPTSRSRRPAQDAGTDAPQGVKPLYEVKETPEAWGVTVFLPGVDKNGLELTAEEGQLRLLGRRAWKQPKEWTTIYRETADAPFELVLAHENAINLDAIAAEIRDGVLRISLPKHEALKPRKIAIT